MIKKILLLLYIALMQGIICFAQNPDKKPLTHYVYNDWKKLEKQNISDNGKFVSYEVNPLKGDGWLHLHNLADKSHDSLYRGQSAVFSSSGDILAFRIVQPADTLRKLKLAKKKKDELPKDSLGIWLLEKDTIIRFAGLKSFQVPKEGGSWVAWLYEKPKPKEKEKSETKDTLQNQSPDTLTANPESKPENPKSKDKKKKKGAFSETETANLTILNPIANYKSEYENVTETAFAKNGNLLAFITLKKDSTESIDVQTLDKRLLKLNNNFEKP